MDTNQSPTPQESPSVPSMSSTTPSAPQSSHSSKKWLPFVIIGGVLLLIVIIAAVALLVLRGQADGAGKEYLSNAKSYLSDYANKVDSSSSPEKALKDTKDLKAPDLKSVVFGENLSGEYKKAQDARTTVTDATDKASKDLNGYAKISTFIDDYKEQVNKMRTATAGGPGTSDEQQAEWFNKVNIVLKDTQSLAEKFEAPSDVKQAKESLINALKDEQKYLEGMKSGLASKNRGEYQSAYSNFTKSSSRESSALREIQSIGPDAQSKISNALVKSSDSL